jgi:hypothetical protein
MKNSNSDVVPPSTSSDFYCSDGAFLREKHRLAGDKFVKWLTFTIG